MLQGLKKDSCNLVRNSLVGYLLADGQLMSDAEIKGILVQPEEEGRFGSLGSVDYSRKSGEDFYNEYLFKKYTNMPEGKLLDLVEADPIFNDTAYFALCSRYDKKHKDQLRKNVDDQFKNYFEKHLIQLKDKGYPGETVEKYRQLEDFLRKQLTRRGFDLLCARGKGQDLDRIRKNMRSGYVKSSVSEIEYMRKRGEWVDIPFLLKAEKDYSRQTSLIAEPSDHKWSRAIAETVYNIGKERLEDLFKITMPTSILVEFVQVCSFASFSKISEDILLNVLNHDEDKVRKITA